MYHVPLKYQIPRGQNKDVDVQPGGQYTLVEIQWDYEKFSQEFQLRPPSQIPLPDVGSKYVKNHRMENSVHKVLREESWVIVSFWTYRKSKNPHLGAGSSKMPLEAYIMQRFGFTSNVGKNAGGKGQAKDTVSMSIDHWCKAWKTGMGTSLKLNVRSLHTIKVQERTPSLKGMGRESTVETLRKGGGWE